MKLGMIHRDEIRELSPALEDELDRLMAAIATTFLVEHTWDGKHGNITTLSINQRFDNAQNTTPSVDGLGEITGDTSTDGDTGIHNMAVSLVDDAVGTSQLTQGAADKVWSTATRALTDKVGFSLTAGSYSVRASSSQHGTGTISATATGGSATISSVTTTRAHFAFGGNTNSTAAIFSDGMAYCRITASTTITATRTGINETLTFGYSVAEYY